MKISVNAESKFHVGSVLLQPLVNPFSGHRSPSPHELGVEELDAKGYWCGWFPA